MAFLDNSGDIILDAVLTDTGRARLAKGDGSFRIAKFALSDDEVDYSLYRNSNHPDGAHPSGSAYYDLEILMTPVLEAFTNNTSSMKSKLISIPRTNLLFLPVMKINQSSASSTKMNSDLFDGSVAFVVAVDSETEGVFGYDAGTLRDGVMFGESSTNGSYCRIDQGLDTEDISSRFVIDHDLNETQYIIEIDNRFGTILDMTGVEQASVSYIDDDNIASYYLSAGQDAAFVEENTEKDPDSNTQVIRGPRGTMIQFKIRSSLELNTSMYLFDRLGNEDTLESADGSSREYKFIDSIVRVSGATTGYSVDVPVRFVKLS
jgi:hypothetical protein